MSEFTPRHLMMRDTDAVLDEVRVERIRQDAKWGEQNHAASVWSTVLTEEVGELAEAILEHRVAVNDPGRALGPADQFRDAMRKEAVQVAAVAVAIVEWIDRGMPLGTGDE